MAWKSHCFRCANDKLLYYILIKLYFNCLYGTKYGTYCLGELCILARSLKEKKVLRQFALTVCPLFCCFEKKCFLCKISFLLTIFFLNFRSLSLDGIGLWLVFAQRMFNRLCQSFELSGCFVLFVCFIPSRLWFRPLSWRAVVDVSCLPRGSEKKSFSFTFVSLI